MFQTWSASRKIELFQCRHPPLSLDFRDFQGVRGEVNLRQTLVKEQSPIFLAEIDKSECRFSTVGEIVDYFREQIESNSVARLIAIFDHLSHTRGIPEAKVADNIDSAVNIVLCFGLSLQDPSQLASRPRSIGICETEDQFVISFRETPMPLANALTEAWIKNLLNPESQQEEVAC
jgi:hypothetical protein